MDKLGFGYYFDLNSLDSSRLTFYWDFNQSGSFSPTSGYYGFSISGNTSSFWSTPSKATLSGTILRPSGLIEDSDSFTIGLTYEKSVTGCQILFNSYNNSSGFILGISDSNKLFCSAFDQISSGFYTKTFDFNLAKKNAIYLKKNGNNIGVGKFKFKSQEFEEDFFIFPNSCNLESNDITFGSGYSSFISNRNHNFIGTLDYIYCYNEALSASILNSFQKSFYKQNPVSGYGIVSEYDNYSLQRANNPVYRLPEFEEYNSGILDYIRNSIFNVTGVGTIKVDITGVPDSIDNTYTNYSGRIYGTLTTVSGYYEVVSGNQLISYSSSGTQPSATGITGYLSVEMPGVPVWHSGVGYTGKIYQVSTLSGVSGVTEYEDVFTNPVYSGYLYSGFVNSIVNTNYNINLPPFTSLSTPGQSPSYVLRSSYTNNGDDKILINHKLSYTINSDTFYIIKKTTINYGISVQEGGIDQDYIKDFYMNGVFVLDPLESGSIVEYNFYTGISDTHNKTPDINLLSGYYFDESGSFDPKDRQLYVNGVNYAASGIGYNESFGFYKTNQSFKRSDSPILDIITSGGIVLSSGSVSSGTLSSGYSLGSGSHFFVNGVKLISGYHYSGQTLISNDFTGTTGIRYNVYFGTNIVSAVSDIEKYEFDFPEDNSIIYKNGIRQHKDIEYIEFSDLDILSGVSNIPTLTYEELLINL